MWKKQFSNGFKRSVYWKNYQSIATRVINQENNMYEFLSTSFQSLKRLFVLTYAMAVYATINEAAIKGNKKYFRPRGKIENHNVSTEGRNFYDQPIDDLIKQYDEEKSQQYKIMIMLQDVC